MIQEQTNCFRDGFIFKTNPFQDEILYYLKDNVLDIGRHQIENRAKELNIKFHPNISTEKLIDRINQRK